MIEKDLPWRLCALGRKNPALVRLSILTYSAGMSETALSVSQLTRQIRSLLEGEIGQVWVEGEISNHRLQTSGHHYFTLKDATAQISCVMFRGQAMRLGTRLADGVQVQVQGELSVYEPRGQYQLVVKSAQGKGLGALQAKFEALKRALAAEGLFDLAHKQPIPRFPAVVALVTSPTGAAIRDMIHILTRRAPWVQVMVYPVRVQGQGAEAEIAKAIQQLNDAERVGLPVPDTIIVGRGGGSLEDLWNFNEEIVVRAIYASRVPIISAVGHEIDFTISDFVADLRAPTPSAAAELVAPDGAELLRQLESAERSLLQKVGGTLQRHAQVLDLTSRGALTLEPQRQLEIATQAVDELEQRWLDVAKDSLRRRVDLLHEREQVMAQYHPVKVLADAGHRIEMAALRLHQSMEQALRQRGERVASVKQMLRLLGPQSVLSRGYSYTTRADGTVVNSVGQVQPGQEIVTQLADGRVKSRVEG
jgi:exodeoxyribonuclease VII large subunit